MFQLNQKNSNDAPPFVDADKIGEIDILPGAITYCSGKIDFDTGFERLTWVLWMEDNGYVR